MVIINLCVFLPLVRNCIGSYKHPCYEALFILFSKARIFCGTKYANTRTKISSPVINLGNTYGCKKAHFQSAKADMQTISINVRDFSNTTTSQRSSFPTTHWLYSHRVSSEFISVADEQPKGTGTQHGFRY